MTADGGVIDPLIEDDMATQDVLENRCRTNTAPGAEPKIVYWHRELAPLEAEVMAEHTIESNSSRIAGTLAHRDELWDRCYRELMSNTERRLIQEVARLGGRYAHVHDESIHPKRDEAAGEAWLHGRFTYVLLSEARESTQPTDAESNRGSSTS
jgi:hypothetical protein